MCVRLDGLPLAIELAAARLRVFTPAELAFRLEHRMALLTGAARDAPDRHRDLRAAIAWSHDLLPERERAVFRRLSVFDGPMDAGGGRRRCAACRTSLDAVESLLDKSLRRATGGPRRRRARGSPCSSACASSPPNSSTQHDESAGDPRRGTRARSPTWRAAWEADGRHRHRRA